jgi:hypothetical protein
LWHNHGRQAKGKHPSSARPDPVFVKENSKKKVHEARQKAPGGALSQPGLGVGRTKMLDKLAAM